MRRYGELKLKKLNMIYQVAQHRFSTVFLLVWSKIRLTRKEFSSNKQKFKWYIMSRKLVFDKRFKRSGRKKLLFSRLMTRNTCSKSRGLVARMYLLSLVISDHDVVL